MCCTLNSTLGDIRFRVVDEAHSVMQWEDCLVRPSERLSETCLDLFMRVKCRIVSFMVFR